MKTYVFQRIFGVINTLCANIPTDGVVLDLGSGSGAISKNIRKHLTHAYIVSLDLSHNMVRSLKESEPGIEAIIADAEQPPFRPNVFDLITCSRMIKMTVYRKLIQSARLIVKHTGRICIVFDSGDVFWVRLLEKLGQPIEIGPTESRARTGRRRTLRSCDLTNALETFDFQVLQRTAITALPLSLFRHIHPFFWRVVGFLDRPIYGGRVTTIIARPRATSSTDCLS